MRIKQRVTIAASAEEVWPYIADPVLMSAWNPKIVEVNRATEGPVTLGERFAMVYRMSKREDTIQMEAIEVETLRRLVYRCETVVKERSLRATEQYEITDRSGGVEVVQTVDLGGTAIPWWIRPLVWFITRFGKPIGKPELETLRDLVERGPDAAAEPTDSDAIRSTAMTETEQ